MHLPSKILSYIGRSEVQVKVNDLQNRFAISSELLNTILQFLAEFGFVHLDVHKQYVRISDACKIIFDAPD